MAQRKTDTSPSPLTERSSSTGPSANGPQNGLVTAPGTTEPSSSLFAERQSSSEIPTIHVTSLVQTAYPDTIIFRQPSGEEYTLTVPAGGNNSIQIPAGDYAFEVIAGDSRVHGNSGDATFRRYHAYDLFLSTVDASELPEHHHIGDE